MKNLSLIIASALAICSCSFPKTIGQATDLNGEWDIVEVNGKVVDTTKRQKLVPLSDSRPARTTYMVVQDATTSPAQ